MKRIKVLHLITRFIKGGADENTMYTILGLDKNKYNLALAFGKEYDNDMIKKLESSSIKVKSFPIKHFNILSSIYSLFLLYLFIKRQKFDIVHTHSTEAGVIGRIAARMAKVPVVIHTIHGIAFTPHRSRIMNYFIIFCEKITERYTTHFISNSNLMIEEYLIKGIGNRGRFTTIYSGIDTKKFNIRKTSNKIPIITIIARFAEGKGHEYFIKAAKKILEERKARFLIVGDGELKKKIKNQIIDLGLDNNIEMLGERKDIPQILSKTDIFVLPTLWEGTPRTIFESMAARVPVITTPVGGIPEIIKDNKTGFLVEPRNSNELAKKIVFVLDNKILVNKVVNNAFRESQRFSYKIMVNKIDRLYRTLLR